MNQKNKIQLVIYRDNPSMEVLVLHYSPPRSYWENLTANMEESESEMECLHRELLEECNIPEDKMLEVIRLGKFEFQKSGLNYVESVFAVKVHCSVKVDISFNPDMEHDRFKWVKPAQAMEMVKWDHMKESVAKIAELSFESIPS